MTLLNEDQLMLQESAAAFLSEKAPISEFRAMRDAGLATGFSKDLWAQFAQMGWAGILVPEEYGGSGFDLTGAGLLAREMGRNLTASPFIATAVMATTALKNLGSDEQKSANLPAIATGSQLFAIAVDESRKHAPAKTALNARRSGNGFLLNGTKCFVSEGASADQIIVAARTSGEPGDTDGITLFLVPSGTDGVTCSATPTIDARGFATLDFTDVTVTADAVLGEVDGGYDGLEIVLDAGRACMAAELTGSATAAFDMTLSYLAERKQFGVPVSSFQALQHRAAHLHTEIEMAEACALKALAAFDALAPDTWRHVAVAKAKCAQVAQLAVQEGVQMHGGMGMTDAFDIGLYMKRARVAGELFGDSAWHANRLADALGY